MSKHHNYSNYSKNNETEEVMTPPVEEEVTETVDTVEQPKVKEPAEEPVPVNKTGMVTDCAKLNVRKNPNTNSEVLCVIEAASKVVIDEENSTGGFYKVCTESGVEGYCMKKFIKIV